MVKTWAIVGVAVLGSAMAWYLWTPLPDQLDQRTLVTAVAVLKKLTAPWIWLSTYLPIYSNMYQPKRVLMNAITSTLAMDSDPDLQVKDEVFDGVKVRVYRPKGAREPQSESVVMFFHGGGWSLGSYVSEDHTSRYLAKSAQMTVVSVEYRLAPEHPFPAALEDCVTATVHVLTHGSRMGMDPARVGVYGLSAGGNLAAAVSLRLSSDPEFESLPRLSYQVLVAPCLQGLDLNLPSYSSPGESVAVTDTVLSQRDMAEFYLSYAGLPISPSNVEQVCKGQHIRKETRKQWEKHVHPELLLTTEKRPDQGTRRSGGQHHNNNVEVNETFASEAEPVLLNYLLSPLLAPEHVLEQVPPAMLVLSQHDVLRDDGLLYARRLRHAGVEVTWHVIQDGHHVSMMMVRGSTPGSDVTSMMYGQIVKFIVGNVE